MQKIHPDTKSFKNLDEAIEALKSNVVKFIIHDAPLLKFAVKNSPQEPFILVGGIFAPSAYAVCFPMGSHLRKEINIKLLEIMEDELYSKLISKWFDAK